MVLPTPLWFVKAVQKEINAFLWSEKPAKIKYKTLICNFDNGGIKLTDFDSFVKAQKAVWAKRLLDNDQPVTHFLQQFIDSMSIADLLCCPLKTALLQIPSKYMLHAKNPQTLQLP